MMGRHMKHTQKRWKRQESHRKDGDTGKLEEGMDYLHNLTVVSVLAGGLFLAAVVCTPVYLARWLIKHFRWVAAAAVGAGIIGAWFLSSCTELF